MAIADLNSLTATIERWTGGSSDTSFPDAILDAVQMCEQKLSRRLRVPEMIKRSVFTTTGDIWRDLPDDFRSMSALYHITELGQGRERALTPCTVERLAGLRSCGGQPAGYVLSGLQVAIAPAPEGEQVFLRAIYYAAVPNLSSASPCTATLLRYPDLYLYGTLASLEGFLVNDARINTWKNEFEQNLIQANQAAARRSPTIY